MRCEVSVPARFRGAVNVVKRLRVYLGADIAPKDTSKRFMMEMPKVQVQALDGCFLTRGQVGTVGLAEAMRAESHGYVLRRFRQAKKALGDSSVTGPSPGLASSRRSKCF